VSYDDCDLEQPDGYRELRRKARKPHKCGDCKGIIQSREFYLYISGIWNRKPENFSRCYDCHHVRCEITRETEEGCMAINGLRSWLLEYCGSREEGAPIHRWVGMFNAVATMRGGKRVEIVVEPPLLTTSP
jgi:hypothetical protein